MSFIIIPSRYLFSYLDPESSTPWVSPGRRRGRGQA